MEIKTPRELAKHLIAPYVLRGDTPESILDGMGGMSSTEYSVNLGNYLVLTHGSNNMKNWRSIKLKREEIGVSKFEGRECCYIFKFWELHREIREGVKQLALL